MRVSTKSRTISLLRLKWWNNFESVSAIASLIGRRTTKTPFRPSVEKWSAIDYHTQVGWVREIWILDRNEEEEWAYSVLCNDKKRETPSFAAGADEYPRGIQGQSIRASASSTRIKGNRHAELIRSGWEVSWESALPADVAYKRLPISRDTQSQKAQSTLDSGAKAGMGHLVRVCQLLVSSTAPESENESRPPAPCHLMAPY